VFFDDIVGQARERRLLSDEHFTVDGTLLEAWAGQKSFQRTHRRREPPDDPGNPTVNFHGERRTNQTHQSTTDPDSRLFKKAKGHEAKLAYLGEVLMEHHSGLVVDACVVPATGTGERDAALSLIASLPPRRITVAGDKGYDTRGFRGDASPARGHAAHRPQSPECGGSADHAARRVRHQPTRAETGRRNLRLDENRGRLAQATPSRWCAGELAVSLRRRRLQSGPLAHADHSGMNAQPGLMAVGSSIAESSSESRGGHRPERLFSATC
jgi:hypothetical protein